MLGLGLRLGPSRTGTASAALGAGDSLVFLLIGQSNMVGRAGYDGQGGHPPGTLQWGRGGSDDGRLIPATAPLQHHDPSTGGMGLDLSFAEAALAANPGITLVLVPAADGGTGFTDNRWNPGNDLYQDAVARTNAVMAQNPGFLFGGFLWHQGESDVGNPGFQTALDAMIAAMRQDVAAADETTPFILGGLVPGWVAEQPNRQATQAIIAQTPNRVAATGVVATDGLTGAGTDIHFTSADLRGLGARYWQVWQAVRAGIPQGAPQAVAAIPDQLDIVAGPAAPAVQGTIPDQTDLVAAASAGPPAPEPAPELVGSIPDQSDPRVITAPAAPQPVGTIPDQTDQTGPLAPAVVGIIPDQEDLAA